MRFGSSDRFRLWSVFGVDPPSSRFCCPDLRIFRWFRLYAGFQCLLPSFCPQRRVFGFWIPLALRYVSQVSALVLGSVHLVAATFSATDLRVFRRVRFHPVGFGVIPTLLSSARRPSGCSPRLDLKMLRWTLRKARTLRRSGEAYYYYYPT